ncbi:MAG TPA: hypothetical protein VM925_29970 [Labilithrix sp.]|nr:hypothetical protein [Labilithrix sp.]
MTWRTAARACGCAVALLLHSGAARADDAEAARAAMRRGLEALERNEATTALAEYETAKRLVPGANAPYYFAANALEMLGRWREAKENLETYLAKDPNVSDAAQVQERIARIRATQLPARLLVRVTGSEEAEVFVDGSSKGRPGTIELSAGSHHVEARAPSRVTAAQEVVLVGDAETSITLSLVPAPVEKAPDVTLSVEPRSPSHGWRTAGWITAGVGTATLATSFLLDALVLGPKIDQYNAASAHADPAARGLRSEVESLQTVLLTTYVAGAVVAAGGLALILFAPHPSSVRGHTRSAALFAF